ncbi:MAG: tRNA pseudouridine(55) synthase TruB [Firmicutes bacterium]|nr:tRNA pseudouridine(55) synthase TruB [Bacillota bacterium]
MNGILNILKPPHMTSSDVVVLLKKIFYPYKVGHMGTLDPNACGVLLIGIGKSVRLFDYLLQNKKKYRATFRLQASTDTGDACGKIISRGGEIPTDNQIKGALLPLNGEIMQTPPNYSAASVGGVRAYDLARRGVDFKLKPKKVFVYSFELTKKFGDFFEFDIECSGGTYIRSLCTELANSLNKNAYMSSLIRLACGNFDILNSLTLPQILKSKEEDTLEELLTPPEEALSFLEKIEISCSDKFKVLNGQKIEYKIADSNYKLFCQNIFLGIGKVEKNLLKIKTHL